MLISFRLAICNTATILIMLAVAVFPKESQGKALQGNPPHPAQEQQIFLPAIPGTGTSSSPEVDPPVTSLTAGDGHTCAVTTEGFAKCWGSNLSAQLGFFGADSNVPIALQNISTTVKSIVAGSNHTCVITTAGGVKCWGDNGTGQLGNGRHTSRDDGIAYDAIGLTSGVKGLAAGTGHTCAVTESGGAMCWGNNYDGQVGNGVTRDAPTPVAVVGLSSGVEMIAVGGDTTCALTTAGGVKCWGDNTLGMVGDGTTLTRTTPVDVVGLSSGVQAIELGRTSVCALTTAGGVKCWGSNSVGQLGDGTTERRLTPVDVVGLTSGVKAITVETGTVCALLTSGGVKCWGNNSTGKVGNGAGGMTNDFEAHPVDVVGLSSGIVAITLGGGQGCARTAADSIKCWGNNYSGELGDGNGGEGSPLQLTPVDVLWP